MLLTSHMFFFLLSFNIERLLELINYLIDV